MPGSTRAGTRRPGHQPRSALLFPLAVGIALAVTAMAPRSLDAQVAQTHEEGIFEIVAERLAPITTIVLIDSAGRVLLPVEFIAHYLGLDAHWAGTSLGVPSPGGATARIDTAASTLSAPAGVSRLTRAEMVLADAVLYLRADRLATLFDADVRIDMSRLTAVFTRALPFPAQQRIVAEQRRAVMLNRQRQLERRSDLRTTPYSAASGAGILDWEAGTSGLDPSRLTTVRTDAGIAVLGGDLSGGAVFQFGHDAPDAVRDMTLLYHRVFPLNRYVRQVQAGDMLTNGLFARYMRGVEISNRPYLRSGDLSSVVVAPDLPAGWEYEVFQGNQMIGYSDISAIDPVSVQVRAGTTPVQVRMYGPAGEEVLSTLVYQMPVSMIPRGDVEYAAAAGSCMTGCEHFAHADVRYGLSALATVGGGLEMISDSMGSMVRPYVVFSGSSGTRATAELTVMPSALYSANIGVFPRESSSVYVRGSVSRPGFGPISIVNGARRRWDTEVFWDERVGFRSSFFSQFRFGAAAAGVADDVERWRFSGTGSFRRGYMEARYDYDRVSTNGSMASVRTAVFTPFTFRSRALRPMLTSVLGAGRAGFQLVEFGGTVQPRSNAIVSAGVQWSRGSSRPALSIGYSATIGSVHSSLRAASSANGIASSSFMVRGSSSFVHDGSVTFEPWARTGYAGVHGTVFVDNDGDAKFSQGDDVVPDVHIIAGGHRVVTDEHGRYRVWSLHAYEPVTIAIDSVNTPDPSWTTRIAEHVVRPTPNMAVRTDIQLVRTRELIGMVEAVRGVPTAAGVTLEIVNVESGDTTTTVTFADGMFYVSRVRPGRYRISVAAASLAALRAHAVPEHVEFVIPVTGDDPVMELEPMQIERR